MNLKNEFVIKLQNSFVDEDPSTNTPLSSNENETYIKIISAAENIY